MRTANLKLKVVMTTVIREVRRRTPYSSQISDRSSSRLSARGSRVATQKLQSSHEIRSIRKRLGLPRHHAPLEPPKPRKTRTVVQNSTQAPTRFRATTNQTTSMILSLRYLAKFRNFSSSDALWAWTKDEWSAVIMWRKDSTSFLLRSLCPIPCHPPSATQTTMATFSASNTRSASTSRAKS